MATGFIAATAAAILNGICKSTTWTEPAAFYIKLHIGDPGAAATANAATETTRKAVTFGDAATTGVIANTVAVTWTAVAASEDYSHYSVWDAETDGNAILTGTLTAAAISAGSDFTIAVGDIDLTLSTAA
jgi:phage gp29-like protein